MTCTVIVGGQWGDEAKGKIASYLALTADPDIAVRAGLGPGAGHTVVLADRTIKLRQVPSAVVNPRTRLLLGAGVLIRPEVLLREIEELEIADRIGVDYRATIIEPEHIDQELADRVLRNTVRTTGSGHGPALASRAMRSARRAEDVNELRPYLVDAATEVNNGVDLGAEVHVEGTNGFGLSVLYGTYPHTVAKDSTAATVIADAGLGPLAVDDVVMVLRAFPTRVGAGVFPTEMLPEVAQRMGIVEFGTVTGRPRRVGRFDADQARAAARINRPSRVALTFLDYVDPACRGLRSDPLPRAGAEFVSEVEDALGRCVDFIGTGPDSYDVIDRRDPQSRRRRPAGMEGQRL